VKDIGSEVGMHSYDTRRFCVAGRVANGDVAIEHLSTMHANVLTKPVEGADIERVRMDLIN
jgi:hypothetical protein